ncbi:FBP domain-containing protein [Blastococcus atacamensis]|uniref:FBP domain-containing protein n=1 Tax=Blastococcus atacamensis TaxID=2070508 RepID=UPI000CEBA1B6
MTLPRDFARLPWDEIVVAESASSRNPSGDAISLFTARPPGEPGRTGNTVGTYVGADLGCAEGARTEIPPWLRDRDPGEVGRERRRNCASGWGTFRTPSCGRERQGTRVPWCAI